MSYPYRRGREIPTPREQDVLDAIDMIARQFSRYVGHEIGGSRDVDYKAVQIYLAKRALGWGFCRIGRRFGGISLQHAMKLHPKGKAMIEDAVANNEITPRMVAKMLPSKVFI